MSDSNEHSRRNTVFLIARRDERLENRLEEIVRCEEIYKQNRSKATEKEVADYLEAQHQRAENLRGELEASLKKALLAGSFVFRGTPQAVGALDSDSPLRATEKHLSTVAEKVFSKYHLAPIQAWTDLAEKFLRTRDLSHITSQNDPLGLVVTQGGRKEINIEHPALVAVKDYLEHHGQVDGARLQDDFFSPEFGWSKDTTRYLIAALLVAGEVKLRVGGGDVTVKGDTAVEALKNNVNFKKTGVALREAPLSPEAKMRAAERVLKLTGKNVMPLEQDISEAVAQYFPEFQSQYASFSAHLENCGLPGSERADALLTALREILSNDASDATRILGAEQCNLFDDLIWAREIKEAFDEGLEREVRELRRHLDEIEGLPPAGAVGTLRTETEEPREQARSILERPDFHEHVPAIRENLNALKSAVAEATERLADEQGQWLAEEIRSLQSSSDWSKLDESSREVFLTRLNRLSLQTTNELAGLKERINHQYTISTEIAEVRRLIAEKVRELEKEKEKENESILKDEYGTTVDIPSVVSNPQQIDAVIARLEKLKADLAERRTVRIDWKIQ